MIGPMLCFVVASVVSENPKGDYPVPKRYGGGYPVPPPKTTTTTTTTAPLFVGCPPLDNPPQGQLMKNQLHPNTKPNLEVENGNILSDSIRRRIKKKCSNGKCKGQNKDVRKKRMRLRKQLISYGRSPADVDYQLAKTQELKRAIMNEMGLGDTVDPADDGLYQDMLISPAQADAMIRSIKNKKSTTNTKATGLFFENDWFKQWDISQPIRYTVHPNRVSRTWDYNDWATLSTCKFPLGHSTILHEVLHALGVHHTQTREDRDRFVYINSDNIQPKFLYNFEIVDPSMFSVYGVEYDFLSLMHYRSRNSVAINTTIPTIYAKAPYEHFNDFWNATVDIQHMGTATGLRESDILLLNRMYCKRGALDCVDKFACCGVTALYGKPSDRPWLLKNCRKSMGVC